MSSTTFHSLRFLGEVYLHACHCPVDNPLDAEQAVPEYSECNTKHISPCWQLQEATLDLTAHGLNWDLALLQQSWVWAV